ncbi:GNAT family N-acetyltransferase [Undibacterium parvum]|uniref:N-acetyltransferase n=1 Tax=Undibacterium parvum TaxID=401471 RepID=A0A3S9HNX5_9BURK|nr:GNAT family N-acetyltransferase [Undibacterium parvum]AZP13779.1 N-acetyltransferase [Undibacterium parvum]
MNIPTVQTYYRMSILNSLNDVGQKQWDALVQSQNNANPFLSFAFLNALHESGSACEKTGWKMSYLCLWQENQLVASIPLYEKYHSYGEYVFDWAWADAYHKSGLNYYPKLLSAIPFTPVSGNRLIAKDAAAWRALLIELIKYQQSGNFSSTHILFPSNQETELLGKTGYLIREGIQFHWKNNNYLNFEEFLATLESKKRKNIRAERRKIKQSEIEFEHLKGSEMTQLNWEIFKQCYDQTYIEHHSSPYLNLDFFHRIGATMPENIQLVFAKKNGRTIAASLLIHDEKTVFGRYWGCLETIPCLHFETAYYQAIDFCIKNKIETFEGGAQGEHKMARGFLPQKTYSAHHLSDPRFSNAVAEYLEREKAGIAHYLTDLNEHTPYKVIFRGELT